jgi:general secretion pathway protein F
LVFPALYVASIRASEQTGNLAETLKRYITYQQQLDSLKSKVVSALIYPVLLISVGGAVILFLMGYVVPSFSHIYEEIGGNLPLVSRFLLAWGNLLRDHWLIIMLLFSSLVILAIYAWRHPKISAALAAYIWRIPAIGDRVRVFQLTRFYRTVGMLLRGGIAIVPALEIVVDLLPALWRPQLAIATRRIREGELISAAMESNGLTTRVASRLMRVGEHAGNMGEMMERIAAFHDGQIARETEVFTRIFGPVLMLLIGVLIGTIVVFMYLPIFQLAESVG